MWIYVQISSLPAIRSSDLILNFRHKYSPGAKISFNAQQLRGKKMKNYFFAAISPIALTNLSSSGKRV
ncbi:hypothetical protein SAMN05421813_11465 [Daejeonella rubra]|uniref:Uncharacterized protein n=1 Tax=Daejeonella rubra TaxID=990371 RepID=A0A1G9TWT0_9SPHI|nr:hypothetical protein SAMN05421813_11465 [Daejeonella rubra]